jgi:hypothetical protein
MWRKLSSLAFAALLILSLLPTMGLAQATQGTVQVSGKIDAQLVDLLAVNGKADFIVDLAEKADLSAAYRMDWSARGHFVYNTLKATAERTQAAAIKILDGRGLKHQTFIAGNVLYVWSGDLQAAEALAALPSVKLVRATQVYQLDPLESQATAPDAELAWGIADAKADQFWASFGLSGEGIVQANIDTGVDWTHEALEGNYKCAANPSDPACWLDPGTADCAGVDGGPCDSWSGVWHGTHTMGTQAGSNNPALPYNVGMAPGSEWITCTGCPWGGCPDFDLNACSDWLLAPGGNPDNRPNVVNNSWGGGGGNNWYLPQVQSWRAAGIFPAFSAGNSYSCNSLGSPGDYQESFGSAAHRSDRIIADFSSKGPSAFGDDPYTKPNISAPGENVWSAMPGDGYQYMSGTSMASPHTAGAVALLWSCNPSLIGDMTNTFEILQDNANTPPDGGCGAPPDGEGNYTYGYGYLDIYEAGLSWCGDTGTVEGHVYQADGVTPIANATVFGDEVGDTGTFTAQTDATGFYQRRVMVGTYDVTASKYGWMPETVNNVVISEDATTTQNFTLDPAPQSVVDGTVTDALTGWPLYARIDIDGYPEGPVFTNPETGYYSVSLADGMIYTFHVNAWSGGYVQEDRTLPVLSGPRTENFALNVDVGACNAPGYEPETSYLEDFEASDGGYSHYGSTDTWQWGAPPSGPGSAHSGVNAWGTFYPTDYSDDYVESGNIDLSALAAGFKISWWQWLQTESCCDYGQVEVSNDGGASWTTIYGPSYGNVDVQWTQHQVVLDASYAVSNFRIRFLMHTDCCVLYPGFYVDDVAVYGECLPLEGGLVVGNVYDDNTDLPLNGATVTADTGAAFETVATPEDPNLDDGFYLLFVENLVGGLKVTPPAAKPAAAPVANPGITAKSPTPTKLGTPQPSAHPEAVLWDQPLSAANQAAYVNQQFSDFTAFSTYLGDDFVNADPWTIETIFVPGDMWNAASPSLYNATALHWEIYADNGGVPAGNPEAGGAVWSLSLPPGDAQVVISTGTPGGYLSNVTLNLATPVNLPAGHYWFVFYPTMAFSPSGQYGRQPADTTNGYTGQAINPQGGFGMGTSWQSWMVWPGADRPDMAFRIEGTIGPVGTPHNLTATMTNYSPDTELVMVPDWGVVVQDFYLGTGHLTFVPPSIAVTLDMGDSTTVNGTLSNDGSGAAMFEFMEQDRGFQPTGYVEYLPMPEAKGVEGAAHNGPVDLTGSPRRPYIFHGNAPQAANIIVYCDDDQRAPSYVELALQAAGLTYTFYGNPGDPGPLDLFTNAVNAGGWDLVILAQDGWIYLDAREYTAVQNHIINGGSAIVYSWGIGYGPTQSAHGLWTEMGAQYVSWLQSPANLYWWEESHPIFTSPESVPEFTQLNNLGYLAYGAKMALLGDPSTGLGGFTEDPADNEAGVILREDFKTLYRGLTDNLNSADQDSDGMPDPEEWWINAIGFILNPAVDVPWLSESPISGTVASGASIPVAVTFDAGVPEVTQPGDYYATLRIKNDTPYGPLAVPVTMTVIPPDTYGKLEGTVASLGYCDGEWIPLEGAVVLVTGSGGMTWTLETDDAGYYQLWLDEANTPVTIDVTYPGNEAGHRTGVVIVGQTTTTEDFDLRWLQPCLSVAPLSMEVVQGLGEQTTLPLTITNDGAATANWEFMERDRGYSPAKFSIPASDGNYPRSNEPTSMGRAPSTGAPSVTQPIPDDIAKLLGAQAYAIDVYPGYNLVTFDTDTPGTWTIIGGVPGTTFFGGDFLGDDTSTMYVVSYDYNTLYALDTTTAAYTEIGPAVPGGGEAWTGLAGAPDGTLYGSGSTCSSSTLYIVDPDTGTTTAVGPVTNAPCLIDIAVNAEGEMYGVDIVNNTLIQINPATGEGTVIGDVGIDANYAQGLDFDQESGTLFWAAYSFSGELRVIDTTTGASTLIGGFPGGAEVDCLSFPSVSPDIPWLSEDPTSGTVGPDGASVTADVTFDASVVTQPGKYYGTLSVSSDDPVNKKIAVPVTMTVSAPDTYGLLRGVVSGLGYCDQNPVVLEGATVIVTNGGTFTLTTNENGEYMVWLDQGTYTVEASADEHTSASAVVQITGQQTTTQDLDLRLIQPCMSLTPPSMEAWLTPGTFETQILTLINTGAGPSAFSIRETTETQKLIPWKVVRPEGAAPSGTSYQPAAFPVVPTAPTAPKQTGALLIQDYPAWGYPAQESIMTANGIPYDIINSSQIATTDLTAYKMVVIPGVQGSSYNTAFNDNLAKFEDYIDGGGLVIMSYCQQSGDIPYIVPPFGGTNNYGGEDNNWIVTPEHPIFAGVSNPYSGNWASHSYLSDLLPDDRVMVTGGAGPGGNTIMIERDHGAGMLVAGGQTFEWGWANGQGAGTILMNMLPYYYFNWEPQGDVPWVFEEPVTGTVGADSTVDVDVTFTAALTMPLGTYTATLIVNTDDAVNDKLYVALTLHVVDCVEVVGVELSVASPLPVYAGDPVEFLADIMPNTASMPYEYEIDFGDGTAPVSGSSSDDPLAFSHTYAHAGTYIVTVEVENECMTEPVVQTLEVTITGYYYYLPIVGKNY